MKPSTRIFLGVLGVALLLLGLWLSLISVIVGIVPQSPNPYVMDGDPCCGIPDTWAQTRTWAFWGWLWLGVALMVFVAGALLVAGGIRGRRLRWRWLPIGVAAAMGIAGAAIVVAYIRLDEAPQVTHCREARERVKSYRSATGAQRKELSGLISECDLLAGRTRPEVLETLGVPLRKTHPGPGSETWHYGPGLLAVRFSSHNAAGQSTVSSLFRDD